VHINNTFQNYFLDALIYTEQMQNKLNVLKTEEKQLNDDLAVFEIKYIQSIEIDKLQKVMIIIPDNSINQLLIYLNGHLPTLKI